MGSFEFCPAGLRVLVVDGNYQESKSLERMLTKCDYRVTTCNLAKEALYMLGSKIERFTFDIVMTDVNLGDVDGFEFVKYVSLNLEIPVIMMSEDGETSKVMKGIECGACDYLVKPIRRKDLLYIWLHVFRKRMQQQHQFEDSSFTEVCEDGSISGKKRKDVVTGGGFSGIAKKPRLIWTPELENKFMKAVAQIGINKATPRLIQNLMKEPSLTRENISSKLQKLKQKMSRLTDALTQKLPTQVSTTWITDEEQNLDFYAASSSSCPPEELTTDPDVSSAAPSDANDFLEPSFFDLPSTGEWGSDDNDFLEPSFFDLPSTEELGAQYFGFNRCICCPDSSFV